MAKRSFVFPKSIFPKSIFRKSIFPNSIFLTSAIAFSTVALQSTASAQAPALKTPAPVIYLAENLDEKDRLGWCIDTVGRGFSEKLHAHSCKPQGGDVQFTFNKTTGQIASAEYKGKCAEIVDAANTKIPFSLLDCVATKASQKFTYDPATREFHPSGKQDICITVSPASRSAGPFMSRDLRLEACTKAAAKYKQWIIKP